MTKFTLEQIESSITSINPPILSTDQLSDLYKNAGTQASLHKPTSEEFKLLAAFQSDVLKQIKSRRKPNEN